MACACVLVAYASGQPSAAPRQLLVGLDDDTAKWRTRPDGLLATYRHLGVDIVRLTIPWQLGQNRPTEDTRAGGGFADLYLVPVSE